MLARCALISTLCILLIVSAISSPVTAYAIPRHNPIRHQHELDRRFSFGDFINAVTAPFHAIVNTVLPAIESIPVIGGLVSDVVGVVQSIPVVGNLLLGPPKVTAVASAVAAYDPNCQIKGGGAGAFNQTVLYQYKAKFQSGITEFQLETTRAQLCQATTLSDSEAAFFNGIFATANVIHPNEGCWVAEEEAYYQSYLPTASDAEKSTMRSGMGNIPKISDREKQLVNDALDGKPPTIQPNDGITAVTSTIVTTKPGSVSTSTMIPHSTSGSKVPIAVKGPSSGGNSEISTSAAALALDDVAGPMVLNMTASQATNCKITGTGSGMFTTTQLTTLCTHIREGMTALTMRNMRAELCSYHNLSIVEARSLNLAFKQAPLLKATDGAFTAQEVQQYAAAIPMMTSAQRTAFIKSIKAIDGLSAKDRSLFINTAMSADTAQAAR